jgi:hypothetical protein
MGSWTNSDGLYLRFGTTEAELTNAGSYPTMVAGQHVTEVKIPDMTDLGTSAAIQANTTIIPKGAVIDKVEVFADTACTSGGSAVLNVGSIRLDRSTAIDADGFVAALPLASMATDGETTVLTAGVTYAGADVGTVVSADYPCLITADYDTAAFTAGAVTIRIFWHTV